MATSTGSGLSLAITPSEGLDLLSLWVESLPLKLSCSACLDVTGTRQHPGFFVLLWFHYLLFLLSVNLLQASLALAGGVSGEREDL